MGPGDLLAKIKAGALEPVPQEINLKSLNLTELPSEVCQLGQNVHKLDLALNPLTDLPEELAKLEGLEILFCLKCSFRKVPRVLSKLAHLGMVSFKHCNLDTLDFDSLGPSLFWVILTDNRIPRLPAEFGQLPLRKLMLSGNLLTEIESLTTCKTLELVRLAGNRIQHIPESFWKLPKLAWVALAGNPVLQTAQTEDGYTPCHAAASELQIGEQLGQGTSGNVFKAQWTSASGVATVAFKQFKAASGSDGTPADEVAAASSFSPHPNVIKVEAIVDPPQQHATLEGEMVNEPGMLLEILERGDWSELGRAPSLKTCTRDVYPEDFKLSLAAGLGICKSIAAAAAHLHAHGVCHGDLYAHNMLVKKGSDGMPCGSAKIGDFGAGFVYRGTPLQGCVEAVEMRAFGCLLEEILSRVEETVDVLEQAWQLQRACVQEDVGSRPSFSDALHRLSEMMNLVQPLQADL